MAIPIPDIVTDNQVVRFTNLEGEEFSADLFVLTHPKTNEKVVQYVLNTNRFYLPADKAIELSNVEVELALRALTFNVESNAVIITKDTYRTLLNENRIKRVTMEYLGDLEGTSYKRFRITPEFKTLLRPNSHTDYIFEDYILISPFYQEFVKQMDFFGGLDMIDFVNFNYEDYQQESISKVENSIK